MVNWGEANPAIDSRFFASNCVAPCAASQCSCTASSAANDFYWSSTSGIVLQDPDKAATVFFSDGMMIYRFKDRSLSVRAVRSRY